MFHNIRNLPLYGTTGVEMFIHAQSSLQIDIQAFSEHCLDTTKYQVTHTAREILRKTYPDQAIIHLNSSSESAIHHYKPGGTGMLVLGQHCSRLDPLGKGRDTLGRWCYISFRRQYFPPVTVISIYQVCPRPTNRIGNTAYHQQERALAIAGRHVHPRKAFIEDLCKLITTLQGKGHDIILGGDFNEALQDKNAGVMQIATAHHLIDPFLSKFPHHQDFGTHENGRRRIDMVLVSPGILPCIQAIGYAPYQYSTASDHRPLVLDLSTTLLFGNSTRPPPSITSRSVKSKDKAIVTKYINLVYDYLQKHQVFQLQASVDDDSAVPLTIEHIDTLIGVGEDIAEKKCQARRPEFYSQKIVQQRFEVAVLKQHLAALRREQDRTTQLQNQMHRTGVVVHLPPTQTLTRKALHQAQQRLRETSQASFETRQEELDQRIQALCSRSQRSHQQILRSIRKAEANLKTFKILKAMRNTTEGTQSLHQLEIPASWPPPSQSISSTEQLEDPKQCIDWKVIRDPAEIEYYLMLRNRLHFGQAEGTPFTEPPLRHQVDWEASSDEANHILEGTYSTDISTPQVQQLLRECKFATSPNTIPHEMSLDEFRGKITSWRESTTTSPSGRHLGRYKAMFARVPTDSDTAQPPFEDKQEQIARLKLSLINYCLRNTYVLNRWKTIVNIMIFKEPGNHKIHKLRVIHIYEADFNALCAIKWRAMLHSAASQNLINAGQYGGRPGCEAQSLTLLEELKYDLSYLTRRSLFNFDNDATSCYDRIVVPLASLINRKYGMDQKIVAVHAATLRQAQFRLKTATGISALSYSHCSEFPIHGTGQGSGNSPCIWLFISSTLFDLHDTQSYGASFYSPDGQQSLRISMVGFVDDSTGSCNDFQPHTQVSINELFQRMEADAQLWNDLLYSSGGKLELQKCSFHLLHFDFRPNGRPVPVLDRYENCIHITDALTQARVPIPSKRSFETHKTLGHYKAPHSPMPSIQHLVIKAQRLSLLIATSPLTRQGARMAYHTVFLPSTKYTLPQSYYRKEMLDQAQAEPHARIIAKCGYNRNTARAIIHAPTAYAGGGFLPWHLLQGEGQVLNFLKHWRSDTIVSRALKLTVCWAQWQSGHSRPILEEVESPVPYLECRWLTSLRLFLRSINGYIILDKTYVAPRERLHDIYIMDYAVQCGLFSHDDLRIINYCRLYLHVTTISELLDADGNKILPSLFHCRLEPWFHKSTYVTIQRRPSEFHIRTKWQKLCRQWISSNETIAQSIDLGPWTLPGEKLRRRRETYIDLNDHRQIYHWKHGSYWTYKQSGNNSSHYVSDRPTSWEPTSPCIPVVVHRSAPDLLVRLTTRISAQRDRKQRPARTYTDYVLTLSPWEQHLLLGVQLHFGPYEILNLLSHNHASQAIYAVSDGSQLGDHITYGWVIGTSAGKVFAEHSGFGFGKPTSHRAEAWGLLSAALFLAHLQVYTDSKLSSIGVPSVTFFSDNAGLIQRLTKRQKYCTPYPNSTLETDWDLVEQAHTVVTQLNDLLITYKWVRGHQDPTHDLPTEAQFNIRADNLAGTATSPLSLTTDLLPWLLPSEQCHLVINKKSIQGHYLSEIRTAYTLPPLFAYLTTRHNWHSTTASTVDWTVFSQAARNSSLPETQLTKLVYNKLPTRYELSKSNPTMSPLCPYCSATETFHHLLTCTNSISAKFRADLTDQLELYFFHHAVPEQMKSEFLTATAQWLQTHIDPEPTTRPMTPVAQSQATIGWALLPKGFFTIEWRHLLDRACARYSLRSTTNSINLLAGLINLIWNAQMTLWKSYQEELSRTSTNGPTRAKLQQSELVTKVRCLHAQRDRCLSRHRDAYFHDDIDQYLTTATIPQMKAYLLHYEPAIHQSIREATKITSRPLLSFSGFTRSRAVSPNPPSITAPPRPQTPPNPMGDPPHKHSKWKRIAQVTNSIKQYFLPSTQPPDKPP